MWFSSSDGVKDTEAKVKVKDSQGQGDEDSITLRNSHALATLVRIDIWKLTSKCPESW